MPDPSLENDLSLLSRPAWLPDGAPVRVLGPDACGRLAGNQDLSLREAEIAALEQGVFPERYLRNHKTLSAADQARLLRSRVALAGLGGLGGILLEGLLRLGFGRIRAADHDSFEPTNLNRQVLCSPQTLGEAKALAAKRRAALVNPAVELEIVQKALDFEGFAAFYAGADVALDALGGSASRPQAQRGAARAGAPLVSAAVAGQTVVVATVLPGGPGPADFFARDPAPGHNAEDVLGCLCPALFAAAALALDETVRLALGKPPRLGGPGGAMAVLDLDAMRLDRFSLTD